MTIHKPRSAVACVTSIVLAASSLLGVAHAGIDVGGDAAGLFTYDIEDYSEYAGVKGTPFSTIGHPSLGITMGERFVGQETSESGGFDVVEGRPSVPLTIDDSIEAEYGINLLWIYATTVVDGLGATGFPNSTAIGDGALSMLYERDQSLVGFDLVGSNGGGLRIQLYDRNGEVLDDITFDKTTNRTYVFFSDRANIAGMTLSNFDWGGVAYDNFIFQPGTADRGAVCDANASYAVDRDGDVTAVMVDAGVPADLLGLYDFNWITDCPGGYFDDPAGPAPTLFVDSSGACAVQCAVSVLVSNGEETDICSSEVRVGHEGSGTPTCPPSATVESDGLGNQEAYQAWLDALTFDQPEGATLDVVTEPGDCGDTMTVTATVSVGAGDAGDCGGGECTSTFAVEDTTAPDLVVEPSEVVVTDVLCEGFVAVDLPVALATDGGEPVVVEHDGPDVFPTGVTTTVTYTATDDCGNTATAIADVTVLYGAGAEVQVTTRTVGGGSLGRAQADMPMEGVVLTAYEKTSGSCAADVSGAEAGYSSKSLEVVVMQCAGVGESVTDSFGLAWVDVPPGQYLLIAQFDLDGDGTIDQFRGRLMRQLACMDGDVWRLRYLVGMDGQPVAHSSGKP